MVTITIAVSTLLLLVAFILAFTQLAKSDWKPALAWAVLCIAVAELIGRIALVLVK